MNESARRDARPSSPASGWRISIILAVPAATLLAMLLIDPIAQSQNYHNFADQRPFLGIPNFGDVASNLGFLVTGLLGLRVCFERPLGPMRDGWFVMFAGIALLGITSSYYHWGPNDYTLVWDRMSLAVGFMGLFIAVVGEYLDARFRSILWPGVLVGVFSVLYWNWFQDLRLYYWLQIVSVVTVPIVILLFSTKYSNQRLLLAGIGWYGLAKLAELGDRWVFSATQGLVSGHTLKHTFAVVGIALILIYLKRRVPVDIN